MAQNGICNTLLPKVNKSNEKIDYKKGWLLSSVFSFNIRLSWAVLIQKKNERVFSTIKFIKKNFIIVINNMVRIQKKIKKRCSSHDE